MMAEEFVPAKEEAPEVSPGLQAFIDDTKGLFEELEKKVKKPEEEPKPESATPAPQAEAPVPPREPSVPPEVADPKPKEDSGFIKDWSKASPEEYQKRINYLYAKDKENERQWDEARQFMQKTREENEKLRAETAKQRIKTSEEELNRIQLQVVDLLDRNSPNYNPSQGAQLLRELTNRDVEVKQEKDEEKKRSEEFQKSLEEEKKTRTAQESATVLDTWAATRDYAKPGHPLYPKVVEWIQKAYQTAPAHITTQDIVKKAEQVFDAAAKQKPSGAPGANGEKLTVSQVIGSAPAPRGAPSASEALSSREREIALKLFYQPGGKTTKEQAFAEYAKGK